ncbi:MAG: DUF3298 domain-containing protein [Lachnospiraceae bacterium]|nr:DUF3298 domain-containing protein [Lachnospiraceae bacterium]
MKMRIKIVLAFIITAGAAVFAGCGSSENMTVTQDDHQIMSAVSGGDETAQSEEISEDKVSEDAIPDNETAETSSGAGNMELINTYFDESRYSEDTGNVYFRSFGNHILCTFDTEKAYPRLAGTLQKLADDEEKAFRDEIREYDRDALDFSRQMGDSETQAYYSHYADDVLKRADDKCVSFVRVLNGFLGGAHPDYYYETYNIYPRTGERIRLSDVVADQSKLNGILEEKLTSDYPDVEYFDLHENLSEYDMSALDSGDQDGNYVYAYDFTLDPDGIAFYFSPYGISAYAYGDQVVKILYDEEPSLFKEDFAADGAYISYITDLDNKYAVDGKAEQVRVEKTDLDESGYFQTVSVSRGGETVSKGELYCYGLRSFIMHTDDGKDYIYINTSMDDDVTQLLVAGLNGKLTLSDGGGIYNLQYRYYYDEGNGRYGDILPLDPGNMELGKRCDLLSTYSAYGEYEAGADGFPKLKGDYLRIPDGYTLTSKAELQTDVVDEDGTVTDKDVLIPIGENYTLYRTDGKEIVDAKLSDGRIVRLILSDGLLQLVNGVIEEGDLFEMLYYAG